MDLNTGEMTGSNKDIVFSKKLRKKKKEHFQVFVIQGTGLGRLKSSDCHEAKVNNPHCQ